MQSLIQLLGYHGLGYSSLYFYGLTSLESRTPRTGKQMADTAWFTGILIVAVLEMALYAGAVFFAYRLTKLTGSFRSWTMIIAALLLTTISGLSGLFVVLTSPDAITALVQSIGTPWIMISYAMSISTCLLYFFGTHGLVKNFQQVTKKAAGPQ